MRLFLERQSETAPGTAQYYVQFDDPYSTIFCDDSSRRELEGFCAVNTVDVDDILTDGTLIISVGLPRAHERVRQIFSGILAGLAGLEAPSDVDIIHGSRATYEGLLRVLTDIGAAESPLSATSLTRIAPAIAPVFHGHQSTGPHETQRLRA